MGCKTLDIFVFNGMTAHELHDCCASQSQVGSWAAPAHAQPSRRGSRRSSRTCNIRSKCDPVLRVDTEQLITSPKPPTSTVAPAADLRCTVGRPPRPAATSTPLVPAG